MFYEIYFKLYILKERVVRSTSIKPAEISTQLTICWLSGLRERLERYSARKPSPLRKEVLIEELTPQRGPL